MSGVGFAVAAGFAPTLPTDRCHDAVDDTKDENDKQDVGGRKIAHVGSLQGIQRRPGTGVIGLKLQSQVQRPQGPADITGTLPANPQ